MTRLSTVFLAMLLALGTVVGCQNGGEAEASEPNSGFTSGEDARALVEAGAALVDVRTPEEFAERHIEGAMNIPLQELELRIADVPAGPVVLYCRSGNRSGQALDILESHGRTDVVNVGGMDDYPAK